MPTPTVRLAAIVGLVLFAAACSSGTTTAGTAPAASSAASSPPTPSDGVVASGEFERIGYDGSGTASIADTGDGLEVRFTDFEVEQGPALRVYLSTASAGSEESLYDDDFLDLGELRSFSGDQTYEVPAGMTLSDYRSVVIWCADFSVGFVVAPIDPV